MTFRLIKSTQHKTTSWSGGTTTELFIFPEGLDYSERSFDFRISTATVELEQTVFSKFDGYTRKLMVLNGTLVLDHDNQHVSRLRKFDLDTFDGSWYTTSIGICEDLNVMLRPAFSSELLGQAIASGEAFELPLSFPWKWFFVYCTKGEIMVGTETENQLSTGDLLLIENLQLKSLHVDALETSEIIFIGVTEK